MISHGKAKWKRKKNGWRDQKEPRQTMQKKDDAPNNQPKKNQKMEDKKKGSLQPRKLSLE